LPAKENEAKERPPATLAFGFPQTVWILLLQSNTSFGCVAGGLKPFKKTRSERHKPKTINLREIYGSC